MKLLVFAHTPPPHHGQSFMVQQMLVSFGGDQRTRAARRTPPSPFGIECYHVNARVSKDLEDIGETRFGKLWLLVGYCLQAIWCRFRYGVTTMYYVPAPGKMAAVIRDWIVMLLCRPFYRDLVLHWHAAGLGKWLEVASSMPVRTWTYRALGNAALSIVISDFNRADAGKLLSRRIERINYGIQDPCPQFEQDLLPARVSRASTIRRVLAEAGTARAELGEGAPQFRVLFLANCLRTKGLFVALEAFLALRSRLRQRGVKLAMHFEVGGAFASEDDRKEFVERVEAAGAGAEVHLLGFVGGPDKDRVLKEADVMCFPTFYAGENQPVTLIESLAYGLPAVTTTWRSIPDIFPPGYAGIVPPQNVEATAAALEQMLWFNEHAQLRARFCEHFTIGAHLARLAQALKTVA